MTKSAIATVLGRSRTTIYSEIHLGSVIQIKASKAKLVYLADYGQLQYEKTRTASFPVCKVGKVAPQIYHFYCAVRSAKLTVVNRRFTSFFAHPYAAWERGSNECHNGLLRRMIPKGAAIRNATEATLRRATGS